MKEAFIKSNLWIGLLASSVAFPIFVVCSAWLFPGGELWSHFAETLLPELITSTFILLVGVGIGVSILGTVLAYLVVMVDFPGRAWLEWALFLPFGIPAYVLAFVYLGVFGKCVHLWACNEFYIVSVTFWYPLYFISNVNMHNFDAISIKFGKFN